MGDKLRVVDLFCGPGGLSEGMRLGGFEIVYGFDKARDAVTTFRANHPGALAAQGDILDLRFEDIPEFDVLVGGPPCVNFSQSKGSRANVLEGLKLVQAFLRLVYERKPRYWIMENVPRIARHLPETIPLKWIGISKDGNLPIPIRHEFNCADYGVPQNRKRYLIGNFPVPKPTHSTGGRQLLLHAEGDTADWRCLDGVLKALGSPYSRSGRSAVDPNYGFRLKKSVLSDHYHPVDLEAEEAQRIKAAKTEHSYMGYMPFPDETNRPARTVVATQLGRETLVLESEKGRFRRATVRECATIQTFPIDYCFFGASLNSRYKQAGDAVPPLLTMQIAREIQKECGRIEEVNIPRPLTTPPPPAVVRKRKAKRGPLPLKKRYCRIVPSKEVRGSRVDFDNQMVRAPRHQAGDGRHDVGWAARLHLGEGKLHKQESILSVSMVLSALSPLLAPRDDFTKRILGLSARLDKLLHEEVPDATSLQAAYTRRLSGVFTPDELVEVICSAVNEFFPKPQFADLFVHPADSLGVRPPNKGIRSRIVVGGLAAAYVAELANEGTNWVRRPDASLFLPEGLKLSTQVKKNEGGKTLLNRVKQVIDSESTRISSGLL